MGLPVLEMQSAGAQGRALGVSALVRDIGNTLAARYSVCRVRGEISGFSRASSGHCYFSLKDADGEAAVLRCAMFRRAAALLGFSPAEGQLVELHGRVGVYEPRGELQLVAESMQLAGAGALYEEYLKTKARLEAQGLFDASRKRSLPRYPQTIGVLTSLGAAALHDVLTALARRAPHVRVVIYPSPVQGAQAPAALVQAIGLASQRAEVDVLVVCRGGGSIEDVWAFNDEGVVRAIVAASMPVVCGVGHETDVTLADFAADVRAPTPTAAAELVAPTQDACSMALDAIAALLRRRVRDSLDTQAQRLDHSGLRLARPGQGVQMHAQRIALLAHRLTSHLPRVTEAQRTRVERIETGLQHRLALRVRSEQERLGNLAARLHSLDPSRVLARGFAWLRGESGRAVTSVQELSVGAPLQAVLRDGSADVLVTRLRAGTSA